MLSKKLDRAAGHAGFGQQGQISAFRQTILAMPEHWAHQCRNLHATLAETQMDPDAMSSSNWQNPPKRRVEGVLQHLYIPLYVYNVYIVYIYTHIVATGQKAKQIQTSKQELRSKLPQL